MNSMTTILLDIHRYKTTAQWRMKGKPAHIDNIKNRGDCWSVFPETAGGKHKNRMFSLALVLAAPDLVITVIRLDESPCSQ